MCFKKKITVIDLLSFSHSHIIINSFWLTELRKYCDLSLYTEAEHASLLPINEHVSLSRSFNRKHFWRLKRELIFAWLIFKNRRSPIFVMGATGIQVLTFAIMERFFSNHSQHWAIVLHSELEGVIKKTPGLSKKMCGFAVRKLSFPRYSTAIVLGSHIKHNLSIEGYHNKNVISIEHPLPEYTLDHALSSPGLSIRVAMIGLIRDDTKDMSAADRFGSMPGVSMYAIGRTGPDFKTYGNINFRTTLDHYSDQWMSDQLQAMDALFICPRIDSYKFTASGTAADGLKYAKPSLWIRHPSLAAFEKSPLAIVGDSPSDLFEAIKRYIPPSRTEISSWVDDWNSECQRGAKIAIEGIMSRAKNVSQ